MQHHADVVVQTSLAGGFGLTVGEAMWKQRPVVGTRIGGIQDQIVDGESGVLSSDPSDLAAFGAAVTGLFDRPGTGLGGSVWPLGSGSGRSSSPPHLALYMQLIAKLVTGISS